jgi:hypothetical protein
MFTRVLRIVAGCGVPCSFGDSTYKDQIGRYSNASRGEPPAAEMTLLTFCMTPAPAPNAAGWPRSCRDWASLLAGEKGRRAADGESQLPRSRVAFAGLAGPEFVIEFETKRDQ